MSEYKNTAALTAKAAQLYEALEELSGWQKQDVVYILNTFVELEMRRAVRLKAKP